MNHGLLKVILLCASAQLNAQHLTQELQRFSHKLKNVTTILNLPTKPGRPTEVPISVVKGPNFAKWKKNCDTLPKYTNPLDPLPKKSALTFELFIKAIEAYFAAMKPILENSKNWLNTKMPDTTAWNKDPELKQTKTLIKGFFSDIEKMVYEETTFVPFAQKITFKPTDVVAFHGDFHGDIHACNNFIQTWINEGYMDDNFTIIKDNFYIIFLGDYTDRGWYGAEVIYTLLRLKLANPTHVFMVRGNHEDLEVNDEYGFIKELNAKFPLDKAKILLAKITRFYNFLPMVFYFSCPRAPGKNDVVQCCHGGIEIGYNPQPFLASKSHFAYIPLFMRADAYNVIESIAPGFKSKMQNDVVATTGNGFMWSDFIVTGTQELIPSTRAEGVFSYGKLATKALLLVAWPSPTHSLRGIFRAHQHTQSNLDPMKQVILNFNKTRTDIESTAKWYKAPENDAGIAFLWSDSEAKKTGSLQNILVLTFSVSPGTPYDWPYDAFGLLTLTEGYDKWHIKIYRPTRKEYEKE